MIDRVAVPRSDDVISVEGGGHRYAPPVPAEVEPPELARLTDFAERPRSVGWSLRAALCRYAQPQPERVSAVLDLVRRSEHALHPHAKLLERDGESIWRAVEAEDEPREPEAFVVELLRAIAQLDRLGDVLVEWAVDRAGDRPDGTVDTIADDVAARLERLGVPHEERPRPPRQRG